MTRITRQKISFAAASLPVPLLALLLNTACSSQPGDAEEVASAAVTFTRDVAPIVFENCAGCHRPGEAGPFPLLTYDDVKGRAQLIAAVTQSGYMPPYLPEPGGEKFTNERRLTPEQVDIIRRWAADGSPQGEPADLPPPPQWTEGWQLGAPDLIIQMPEAFTLPASGPDVLRLFAIPIPLEKDRYVEAFEFRPGNAKVVRHARMLFGATGQSRDRDAAGPEPGYGASMLLDGVFDPNGHWIGWTPGKQPVRREEGRAWRLRKGAGMVLEMHMLPTGKAETIQSSMGFYFTDKPPSRVPAILRLGLKTIDIAPGEENYVMEDSYILPVDAEVLNVYPHAHYLCKEMTSVAKLPGGQEKTLLRIKEWDFDWQDQYQYAQPVFLPAGTEIRMRFVYDNSAANPENPGNPPVRVTYGWTTSGEMGDLWLQVLPSKAGELAFLRADFAEKEQHAQIEGLELQLEVEPGDYAKRNMAGIFYLEDGQYERARAHFERVAREKPDHEFAVYNLGVVAETLGNPDQAIRYYRRALDIDPGYAEPHNNLGVLLAGRGEPGGAEKHFRAALKTEPDHARANNNIGIALGSRGEFEPALGHFRRALAADPAYAEAHNNMAITLGSMGRFDEAMRHFRKAIKINPRYAEAQNNLGGLLGTQGKFDEAIKRFQAAIKADPDFEDARRNLKLAQQAKNNPQ